MPPAGAAIAGGPTAPALQLAAARAELEGRQVVVRPTGSQAVTGLLLTPSDLVRSGVGGAADSTIPANRIQVLRVEYVRLRVHSTGVRGVRLPASLPDPLPPTTLEDGRRIAVELRPATTRAFYVLVDIPVDATAGAYRGTLAVTAGNAPEVDIPFQVTVYPFSIAHRSLRTFFGLSINSANRSRLASPSNRQPGPGNSADFVNKYMRFMLRYRLSPQTLVPGIRGAGSDGQVAVDTKYIEDYLGTGSASTFVGQQLDFATAGMPDFQYRPSYVLNPFTGSGNYARAANYYRTWGAALRPWWSKVVAYPVDEPTTQQRAFTERYGAFLHKYASGAKYLVTVDPSRFGYRPFKTVDIYVNKLHFWYRDRARWVAPLRHRGKQVWIYVHATEHQGYTPMFLIDKPAVDSRMLGWFAYDTQAPGLLYESVNRWRGPQTGSTAYRDPYRDPLSARLRQSNGLVLANGSASLIYPGYYPSLGLDIRSAGPVSSLRMEALRDGLEDYEYLKLLEQRKGRKAAAAFVHRLIGGVRPGRDGNPFPRYTQSAAAIEKVRSAIARAIAGG